MDIGNLLTGEVEAEVPFEEAMVRIRHVPRNEITAIARKSTKLSWNSKHQQEETVDGDKSNQLMGAAAILGWSGFMQNGEDFPFSPENRDMLMLKWTDFSSFVNTMCTNLTALVEAGREEARKKSLPTSEQNETSPE